jgi:methionine-rich copper-binding protein CopC
MHRVPVHTRIRANAGVAWAIAFLLMGVVATTASAHASFVRGTPGPGDVLSTPPAQVDAYFAQNIRTLSGQETYALWVTDSSRNQVDNNDNTLDPANPRHLWVTLPSGLGNGVYSVNWYTVSDEDGHDDSGNYTFTIKSN